MGFKSFFNELKRRNIYKVAITYAIAGWVIIQIATAVFPALEFPQWTTQFVIILVVIGLPITLILTWAFEITPKGVKRTKTDEPTQKVSERTFWVGAGLVTIFLLGGWWYLTMEPTGIATKKWTVS